MRYKTLSALALALALACCALAPAHATPETQITPLMSMPLKDIPGKEALMLTVSYPPGGSDPVHRHGAHVFVYVLEGAIEMQARGKPAVMLKPGQTLYESPDDVHVVGRNTSATEPAKFLAATEFWVSGRTAA